MTATFLLTDSNVAPGRLCAGGCGTPLPPTKGPGRARKWCSEKCRKGSYGDPCVDCGKRTTYGAEHARVPEPRCPVCSVEARRVWTEDGVIEAIRQWAAKHGEPPATPDWNPWHTQHILNDPERAQAGWSGLGVDWPSATTVRRMFGSWEAGLRAAGFEPRAPHGGGGNQWRRRNTRRANDA